MIRISRLADNGSCHFKIEGRALGTFGDELRKFLEGLLDSESRITLDLEGLLAIDQPTLEFLAHRRDRVILEHAPRYLDRWILGAEATS
ncbi:MAG: hypothetical protein HZB25_06765 [Candidatus Eisenbacteria bacterium]|nr:hypothetical protein [Candidatus Eisenbacteria bacterium]